MNANSELKPERSEPEIKIALKGKVNNKAPKKTENSREGQIQYVLQKQ